jgi:cold shock CspA family protein
VIHKGIVKSVRIDKGFGFLTSAEFPNDVFFHVRQASPTLPFSEQLIGSHVEFDIEASDKGPRAVGVRQCRKDEW